MPFAAKTAGILLPFEDILYSDPYAELTRDITSAFYAGYSVIRGARCEHVALAAPGISGEIWIDAKTDLPCLIAGALLNVQGLPVSRWNSMIGNSNRSSRTHFSPSPNPKVPNRWTSAP